MFNVVRSMIYIRIVYLCLLYYYVEYIACIRLWTESINQHNFSQRFHSFTVYIGMYIVYIYIYSNRVIPQTWLPHQAHHLSFNNVFVKFCFFLNFLVSVHIEFFIQFKNSELKQ